MDFKDKIIMCLVVMVVVLCGLQVKEQEPESEPEPQNKIEYQLQDANGRVIVSCRGDINSIQFCIEKSREVNK